MSNKPKIYGYCAAGCKWETVHRSEVAEWASQVREILQDGTAYLQLGKEYRITAPKASEGVFDCSLALRGFYPDIGNEGTEGTITTITIPTLDKYADSFVFRLLEQSIDGSNNVTIIYEIAGIRYSHTHYRETGNEYTLLSENQIFLTGATSLFVLNSGMSISVSVDGTTAEINESELEAMLDEVLPLDGTSGDEDTGEDTGGDTGTGDTGTGDTGGGDDENTTYHTATIKVFSAGPNVPITVAVNGEDVLTLPDYLASTPVSHEVSVPQGGNLRLYSAAVCGTGCKLTADEYSISAGGYATIHDFAGQVLDYTFENVTEDFTFRLYAYSASTTE